VVVVGSTRGRHGCDVSWRRSKCSRDMFERMSRAQMLGETTGCGG
jgi:hypothetical protein